MHHFLAIITSDDNFQEVQVKDWKWSIIYIRFGSFEAFLNTLRVFISRFCTENFELFISIILYGARARVRARTHTHTYKFMVFKQRNTIIVAMLTNRQTGNIILRWQKWRRLEEEQSYRNLCALVAAMLIS